MTLTKYRFVDKGAKIWTDVEGGVCMKAAPCDGVILFADAAKSTPIFMSQEMLLTLLCEVGTVDP